MNQIICAKKHISSHPTVIPCALSLSLLATNVKKSNDCSLLRFKSEPGMTFKQMIFSLTHHFPLVKLIKKQILQCSLTFNAILYSAMCWFSIFLVGLFWKNLSFYLILSKATYIVLEWVRWDMVVFYPCDCCVVEYWYICYRFRFLIIF